MMDAGISGVGKGGAGKDQAETRMVLWQLSRRDVGGREGLDLDKANTKRWSGLEREGERTECPKEGQRAQKDTVS
jgi:hypothetical protein